MAANTVPIWTATPNIGYGTVATANTALDGTGTSTLVFTAGSEGARIERVRVKHLGTNVASVLRLFLNNGSTPATASNNALIAEVALAANTLSQTAASAELDIMGPWVLPAGYRLYATVGTTIAAGVAVSVHGGNY